jgi:hypothetical protein
MMGKKYFKNIPMPCKNDMGNLFHMYMDENHKINENLDENYINELFG